MLSEVVNLPIFANTNIRKSCASNAFEQYTPQRWDSSEQSRHGIYFPLITMEKFAGANVDSDNPVLYTVGHSAHAIDYFIDILRRNEIEAVADVRSSPYSKFTPQFNHDALELELKEKACIRYVSLGKELGARRSEPECYTAGKVVYSKVAVTGTFQRGISRLRERAAKMRVAIMCAEKDPLDCHRNVLVANYAREYFSDTLHILADGSIETQAEVDARVLQRYKLKEADLFQSGGEILARVYAMRAGEIAYEEHTIDG